MNDIVEFQKSRLEASREKGDRLFLAAIPDADTAADIHALAGRLRRARGFTGRLIRVEHLHVSLIYLGHWDGLPEQIVARAQAAAATVKQPPFEVVFDRTTSFGPRAEIHPFVLVGVDGVGGLKALHKSLGTALERAGLRRHATAAYTPHMTLLYDKHFADETPVAPICWTAREFALVHSLYGRTTHIHLARWPLGTE